MISYEGGAAKIEEELGEPMDDPDALRRLAIEALRECDRLRIELEAHGIDPDHCDEIGVQVRRNMCGEVELK